MAAGRRLWPFLLALAGLPAFSIAADMPGMPGMAMHSGGETLTKSPAAYRIELHILPPEGFYSAGEVAAKHISAGMLIVGGAAPLAVDASSPPNHHIIVHVFDGASGTAVTGAKVRMSLRAVNPAGRPSGARTEIPMVTMQALGAGAASTHYGNNLVIPASAYSVTVTVSGATAHFPIKIAS